MLYECLNAYTHSNNVAYGLDGYCKWELLFNRSNIENKKKKTGIISVVRGHLLCNNRYNIVYSMLSSMLKRFQKRIFYGNIERESKVLFLYRYCLYVYNVYHTLSPHKLNINIMPFGVYRWNSIQYHHYTIMLLLVGRFCLERLYFFLF